ncbi:hydroxymethylglutaryl-CoA lyase [Thermomicrobium sp. CFH 73360]|uniref:hydroxymethylglutaryl-CoA lyase n=1 Tax=Thermomicrobium sp. CFH 73360 TaxID=2951987 RepID=UPI0020770199|nr:hydroxymethylglutaryl-CoA lyase [Thermomicrobium sp. CFH 73360]
MTTKSDTSVKVIEVGPRDGLQNEPLPVPTEVKVAFIDALSEAGFPIIECTSFVSPAAVPQLADAEEVMRRIRRRAGTRYLVLVPNERGLERALAVGCDAVALFAAATEAFSQANLRASIADTLARYATVTVRAQAAGCWVRGYVSVAFHCPYSGPVAPEQAITVALRLLEFGCDELAIADTIGRATPDDVARLLEKLLREVPAERVAVHLHDTTGKALDNVAVALSAGIRAVDAALGGLGGCPFAPGAPGNLATEALLDFLDTLGYAHGIDRRALRDAWLTLQQGAPELVQRGAARASARSVDPTVAEELREGGA